MNYATTWSLAINFVTLSPVQSKVMLFCSTKIGIALLYSSLIFCNLIHVLVMSMSIKVADNVTIQNL